MTPTEINQSWSMDFMSDNLVDGRSIRSLNNIIEWRGKPSCLRCDNGTEYISCKLEKWAIDNQITLIYV